MKALVVGGGSIGSRQLQNLRTLGVEDLALAEIDVQCRRSVLKHCSALEFASLEEGLQWSPDFVVLATPTHLHAEQAKQVLELGLDLFVEKPLCHAPESLAELVDLAGRQRVTSLVGCNMRFHPGPAKVKELLGECRIGKLLFARIQAGSYLPDWRPGCDYRQNYAANEATGGGCILDCIHEIDLARWYLGNVEHVFCFADQVSSLQISTEDVAALTCIHAVGTLSEIHLDYVQRTYERGCQIVGDEGSIFWDFNEKQVRWYNVKTDGWTYFTQPKNWQVNEMHLAQMEHFLDCVRTRKKTVLPIVEAAEVMRIAFAAKASARQRKIVATAEEVFA